MHVERTADPHVLRWVLHHDGLVDALAGRRTPPDATPFGELMGNGEIEVVDLVEGDLFVHAASPDAWASLAPKVRDAARAAVAAFDAGTETWLAEPTAASITPALEAVQRTVDAAAGSLLGSHGGTMTVVDVTATRVDILPGGACDGCSLSNATLLQTLQPAIKAAHPGVVDVRLLDDGKPSATPVSIPRPRGRRWLARKSEGDCH